MSEPTKLFKTERTVGQEFPADHEGPLELTPSNQMTPEQMQAITEDVLASRDPADGFVIALNVGDDEVRNIVSLDKMGELHYGETYRPDKAAEIFWLSMRDANPYRRIVLGNHFELVQFRAVIQELAEFPHSVSVADCLTALQDLRTRSQQLLGFFGYPFEDRSWFVPGVPLTEQQQQQSE